MPPPPDDLTDSGDLPEAGDAPGGPRARPGPDTPVRVRDAGPRDVATTARLHVDHLGVGLFPRLGPAFVARWHATYLCSPVGVALVAESGPPAHPRIVGYLIGSTDEHSHVSHVLRHHRLELARSGAAALLARPRVAASFLATRLRRYARRLLSWRGTPAPDPQARSGVLTALVVVEDARHSGAGRALVAEFEDRARAAGSPRLDLVTKTGEGGAGAFYRRLGWTLVTTTTSKDGGGLEWYHREPGAGRR